jgi:uncharacterized DUF497 family protein
MLSFEFDEQKSQINLEKHGIDFVQAQNLWSDPYLIEIPAKTTDEPRFMIIDRIKGKHWAAIIAYRSKNIRITSVRRARPEEVILYESKEI